jgi:hypothetical protein
MRNAATLLALVVSVAFGSACALDVGDGEDEIDEAAEEDLETIGTLHGETGKLNLWDDTYYRDRRQSRSSYDSNFGNDGFDDKTSSVMNRTGDYWLLFEDRNYGGRALCIRPFSHVANLKEIPFKGAVWGNWNDIISSVRRKGYRSISCNGRPIVGAPN